MSIGSGFSTDIPDIHLIPLLIFTFLSWQRETAVAQWLSCCATNWKVAGSIPDGFIGIFH
jgi:hypothetical protein